MKCLISKIWITLIVIFNYFSCYSQWNNIDIENFYWSSYKPSICFLSADTGYIIASNYDTKQSYFYITKDSGLNWSQFDTINNCIIKGIECKYGFNLSYGTNNDEALVIIFENNNFYNKRIFQIPNYKVISEVNVVDPNNAVFYGMNADSIYELGLLTKEFDSIKFTTLKTFGNYPIDKINFFSANQGYYSIQGDLYYMNSNSISQKSSNIIDFDFHSLDSGIVIKTGGQGSVNIYKTNNKGDTWEYSTNAWISFNYVKAVMNSNSSLYIIAYWYSSGGADAYISNINLLNNTIVYFSPISLMANPPDGMDLYFFSKDQGYFVTHLGQLAITLNNGGLTSINELEQVDNPLYLYPNPCKDVLNIEINSTKIYDEKSIVILNTQGQIIKVQDLNFYQNHIKIDISDLDYGIYFLSIQEENSKYYKTFIKF